MELNPVNTSQTLIRYISEELFAHLEDNSLTEDDDLLMSGRVDSLGVMRLVAFIEEECGVMIPPEDVTLENFRSVRLIAAYLEKRADVGP